MFKFYYLFFSTFFFTIYNTCADPILEKGKTLAEEVCSVCHGVNGQANTGGNSVLVPNLTAQNEYYLIEKLKAYKSKKINHHQMSLIADMLSIEDIKNVAKWYSSIKIQIQEID